MSTLTLKQKTIIPHVFVIFLLICMLYFFNDAFRIINQIDETDFFNWFLLGMVVCLNIVFVFSISMLIFTIHATLKYKILFNSEFVEENRRLALGRKPIKIFYSEISSIDYHWTGVISIQSKSKKLSIQIKSIEGEKEKVISTLKNHISSHLLPTNLSEIIEKLQPIQKTGQTGMLIILSIYFILMLTSFGIVSVYSIGWNVFEHWGAKSVAGFWLESPDSIWVVTNQFGNQGEVIHYEKGIQKTWRLPDSQGAIQFSNAVILIDNNNLPTVIDRDGNIHALKKDETWETVKTFEENSLSLFSNYYASNKNEAWFIIRNDGTNILAKITADSNTIEFISLPKYAKEREYEPYKIFNTYNGNLLVLAGKDKSAIFVLKNGEWDSQIYEVNEIEDIDTIASNITLDKDGKLYILHTQFPLNREYYVEMITENSRQITQIPNPSRDIQYEHIEIDKHGRLWLMGGYNSMVKVLKPNWGGMAEEIVTYTETNSSYSGDDDIHPILLSNGQLWSGDYRLVWIDTNIEEFPKPLPNWLANYWSNRNYSRSFYPFLFIMFFFAWYQFINYKSKKILNS